MSRSIWRLAVKPLSVDAITAIGPLRNTNNVKQFVTPYVDTVQGAQRDQIRLVWPSDVRGKIQATVRMDFR